MNGITSQDIYETDSKDYANAVKGKDTAHQYLLDRLLLQLFLLLFEVLDTLLKQLDVLFVPSEIVLSLNCQLFLNQISQHGKLVCRQGLRSHILIGFVWQINQGHFKPMHRWDAGCKSLSDLAHALGHVFVCSEHVTLRHVKLDVAPRLHDELAYQIVRFLAKGLSNWVQKYADEIAVLSKPLIDAFNVKFVAKTSVSQAWSVDEHDLLKVPGPAQRSLDGHTVKQSGKFFLLCLLVDKLFHERQHLHDIVST